jgi:hypothetical protein
MKVAQQFIAGIALRRVRPDRDDRFTLCPREVPLETITSTFSIVPSGTAPPLHHLPSNELLGYFHEVPSGTRPSLLLFPVPRPPCSSLSHTVSHDEAL